MASLDQILGTLGDEEPEKEEFIIYDGYPVLPQYKEAAWIDINDRKIVSLSGQNSVSGESNSQYIEFKMGRHYDGIDMMTKRLQVVYEVAQGTAGVSTPVNVRYSKKSIILGWVVPAEAVSEASTIRIALTAIGTEDDKTYIWKTVPIDYIIPEGIQMEKVVPEIELTWFEQITQELNRLAEEIEKLKGGRKEIVDYTPTWDALSPGGLVNVETPELHAVTGTLTTYTLEGE